MIYDSSTENMVLGINDIYRITDISREDFEKEAVHVGLGKKFAMQFVKKWYSSLLFLESDRCEVFS